MTDQTLLLRQIHPSFVQGGRVTSQAFRPTPKDEKKLSVYDGDQITPEESFEHFTQKPECKSCGVMGVAHSECDQLDLKVIPDPETFPEHVLIDFSALSRKEIERKAKQLRAFSAARGWQYQAGE